MRFALETLGVKVVDRELLGISGRVTDMAPAMDEIFKLLFKIERKQFDTQGGYGSGGWAPLADSTVKAKRRKGLDRRILRAHGDLFKAVTSDSSATVANSMKDGLVFGTSLGYPQFHQQGRGVPKRPIVDLPEGDKRKMVKILQQYVVDGEA